MFADWKTGMKTKRPNAAVLILPFIAGICVANARCLDKKTIQQKTNQTYYNLKNHGLDQFSCNVLFDWDGSFAGVKTDAIFKETILPIAKQMKFQVSVGPTGAASVSHQFGQAPPNEGVADRLRQISEGIDQMLGGFFETWSQLMMNPPLRGDADDYEIEEKPDGYRVTAQSEKLNTAITMKRDFTIESIEAKTPEFEGVVRPKFEPHNGEFVLESYDGDYKTDSGVSQRLSITVQYQAVDGLLLPRVVKMLMTLPQGQVEWPMTLDGCQVKKQ